MDEMEEKYSSRLTPAGEVSLRMSLASCRASQFGSPDGLFEARSIWEGILTRAGDGWCRMRTDQGASNRKCRLIGRIEDQAMKTPTTRQSINVVAFFALFISLSAAPASGDAVTVWSANAGVAATAACIAPLANPLHESRIYAMMHVAIHDALNAIDRRSRPYAFDVQAEAGASPDAAVAAAARDVLVALIAQLPLELLTQACIDAGVASAEAAYTAALLAIPDNEAKTEGIAVGQAAAAAILDMRAEDGAVGPFLNFACPQETNPGEYQCTPGTPFIAFQVWKNVTPFVLRHSSQFRPGPPYAVTMKKYTADFNEVKSLGGDDVTTPSSRSADQTQIALFWYESSPLKWNRIARTVSAGQGLTMWENARLFGLLNMALADGYIAMVDTKNHYNYWRPITTRPPTRRGHP
jgi:hypothetical protein